MTTMSMNTARPAIFTGRAPARPAVRTPSFRGRTTTSLLVDWCIERVPGIAGRFGLALVPFSLLAWMFSV